MGVYDYHHDSGRSDRPEVRSDAPLSEHAQETLKFIYDGQKCGIRIFVSSIDGDDENGNS